MGILILYAILIILNLLSAFDQIAVENYKIAISNAFVAGLLCAGFIDELITLCEKA